MCYLWLDLGFGGFTLSPEDDADNLAALVREFPDQATVIVYQDTPLFLAANLTVPPGPLTLGDQRFDAVHRHGTLIMIHDTPFSLVPVLLTLRNAGARHLRADFLYRDYTADWTLSIWRQLRMGEAVPGRLGNARRGLADIHQETEKWESL